MKGIITFILLLFSFSTYAIQLTTYQSIEDTLNQGQLITLVLKYKECKADNPNSHQTKVDTAIFKPNAILMSDEGYLGVAGNWFTTGWPNHEKNGVNQHYKITLNQNIATLEISFFDPETGRRFDDIKTISAICELNKGIRVYN